MLWAPDQHEPKLFSLHSASASIERKSLPNMPVRNSQPPPTQAADETPWYLLPCHWRPTIFVPAAARNTCDAVPVPTRPSPCGATSVFIPDSQLLEQSRQAPMFSDPDATQPSPRLQSAWIE